jgi:hypothetical protein
VPNPFPAWHRAATQLADDLDATAIDNEGQPITLHNYAAIGQELGDLYRQLQRWTWPQARPRRGAVQLMGC